MLSAWQQSLITTGTGDPLWNNVSLLLGITAAGAKNLKTGASLSIGGSAVLSDLHTDAGNVKSVYFPATGAPTLSLADDPSIAFGTGDFTIEWSFYPQTISPGGGYPSIPVMSWGGSRSTDNANIDILFYAPDSVLVLNANNYQSGLSTPTPPTSTFVNRQVTAAIVRKDGMVSVYIDGTRIGSPVAHTKNMTHSITAPLYIGRRQGGGGGEIIWYFNGYYSALRITKAARYDGPSYSVPVEFLAS